MSPTNPTCPRRAGLRAETRPDSAWNRGSGGLWSGLRLRWSAVGSRCSGARQEGGAGSDTPGSVRSPCHGTPVVVRLRGGDGGGSG